MDITFYGAVRETTGSMHMLHFEDQNILLECGLYQGPRAETRERNLNFPFAPSDVNSLILSHAHIDHCGNIPNLVKQGFSGNVYCTAATRELERINAIKNPRLRQKAMEEFINNSKYKSTKAAQEAKKEMG